MTTKEKALELYNKFKGLEVINQNSGSGSYYSEITLEDAKECALLCVEEIIDVLREYVHSGGGFASAAMDIVYYEEVKQEIEKL